MIHGTPTGTASKPLTPRELDVLIRTAQGDQLNTTALHLHMSISSVKKHRIAIKQKLQADTMAHAVSIAYVNGILHPSGQNSITPTYNPHPSLWQRFQCRITQLLTTKV